MISIPNSYERCVRVDNYYPRLRDLQEDDDLSQQQGADYLGKNNLNTIVTKEVFVMSPLMF